MARSGVLCLFGLLLGTAGARPVGSDAAHSGTPTEAQALERFQARHAVLRCGGGRGNEVPLTFDDGPTALTRRLLGVLDAHGAKATFFVIGREIATHRRAVALAAKAGDEIGNHSWSQPTLTTLARSRIDRELAATSHAIIAASGQTPRLIRPPGGRRDAAVDGSIRAHRLIETLWSVAGSIPARLIKIPANQVVLAEPGGRGARD